MSGSLDKSASQNRLNVEGAERGRKQVREPTARRVGACRKPIFHYRLSEIQADICPGKKIINFPHCFLLHCLKEDFAVDLELC